MKLKDLKVGDRYRLPQHPDEVCVYLGEVPHQSGVGTTHSFIFRGDEWNQDDGEFEVAELLESAEEGFSVPHALWKARYEKYDLEVFRLLQCAADDAQKMMHSDWPQCATLLCRAREALHAATQLVKTECVGSYALWVFQCQLELERMATNHPKYSRDSSLIQRGVTRSCTQMLLERGYGYAVSAIADSNPRYVDTPLAVIWLESNGLLGTNPRIWRVTPVPVVNAINIERAAREFARNELNQVWGEV